MLHLRRAYINFFEHRAGFPKFKKKKAARQSFRIPQRVRMDEGCVYVPSIGRIRIRQSEAIDLATKSASFKRTAVGHWFVTLVAEFEMPAAKVPIREDQAVGFDMVLASPNFLVGSDGEACALPGTTGPGRGSYAGRSAIWRAHRRAAEIARKPDGVWPKFMSARRICARSFCTSCLISLS
jgi:putative transposase